MVVQDQDFADLFPARGQPAGAPVCLALATLLQFVQGLIDRQAADAVRTRIDWKYVLCLELTDVGFDHTVLSEFCKRACLRDQPAPRAAAAGSVAHPTGERRAAGLVRRYSELPSDRPGPTKAE